MTLNKISLIALSLFSGANMFAQSSLLNAETASDLNYKPMEEIFATSDGPIAYQKVNENDILFEKKVWEKIPLNERSNFVYYYPERATVDRKPLFDILKEAVLNKSITEVYSDENFKRKVDVNKLADKFYRIDTTEMGYDYVNMGEPVPAEYIDKVELRASVVSIL